ncbi:MAG: iron ABC transporter substrate-binding protein [Parvibaculum sp.]|jgi:iron complex transport system substrate-binding protein|nr:iron ABC transporter substrate-binding protein [Parvibaculum sp.]|tara:strand:+ start:77 stop:925 length:849 start_codon:yes stop_codon:yes gene_type:complete
MNKVAIGLGFGLLVSGVSAGQAAGPSVASLDFCADQYVLALADTEQIVGVSPHAETEFSYFAEKAAGIPKIRPTAEEILVLEPEMVVRLWGGGYGAKDTLERYGIPVVQVSLAVTLEETKANLLAVGKALGHLDRAEAIVADLDTRILAIQAGPPEERPVALYVTPSGTTTGRGTFVHEMMITAGVENMSAELGTSPWHPVNLEALALSPPDMIVAGFFDLRSGKLSNWSLSRHEFLRRQGDIRPVARIPSREIACAAWFVVDAIEEIAATRRSLSPDAVEQ